MYLHVGIAAYFVSYFIQFLFLFSPLPPSLLPRITGGPMDPDMFSSSHSLDDPELKARDSCTQHRPHTHSLALSLSLSLSHSPCRHY